MTDALATTARLHPDLRWSCPFGIALYGADDDAGRDLVLLPADGAQRIEISNNDRVTHREPHPGATLEALAAEAVDLRRAIGWPVGVAS